MVLTGPGDSAWVGFTASLPPSALRFAREDDLVAARYQVVMVLQAGPDTLVRDDRHEVVRVTDFAETTSRDPNVVFQRFVAVPPGRYEMNVTVRELTSRRQASGDFTIEARSGLSQPLLAYRGEPRSGLREPPSFLLQPRSTWDATRPPPVVLVEDGTGAEGTASIAVQSGGTVAWSDTLSLSSSPGGPASAVAALPVHLLPPGRATVRVVRLDDGTDASAPLYTGLSPEWVFPTWSTSIEHLVYALEDDSLQAWRSAASGERPALWRAFQERTDPDASTPENEFLRVYFERMSEANDRFDEPGQAGWESDRGEVLVKLGEPDRQRFVRPERQGEVPRIEWEYEESIPTSAVIVFEDASDFGVFVLTPRSRTTLRRVQRELAERGASE